jgi:hypothetical protein
MPESNEQKEGALAGVASADLLAMLQWLDALQDEIGEDCSVIYYGGIVKNPEGTLEAEGGENYDEMWVDQKSGVCEDDYYGTIYVKKGDVWLRFPFQC